MTEPTVVLVGPDGDALGRLAAELEADGRRVSVFVGDPAADDDRAALREMLAELFPDRATGPSLRGGEGS